MGQGWLDLAEARWTVRADASAEGWPSVPEALRDQLAAGIPATVPGVVHTDLLGRGLIADPYLGTARPTSTGWARRPGPTVPNSSWPPTPTN